MILIHVIFNEKLDNYNLKQIGYIHVLYNTLIKDFKMCLILKTESST